MTHKPALITFPKTSVLIAAAVVPCGAMLRENFGLKKRKSGHEGLMRKLTFGRLLRPHPSSGVGCEQTFAFLPDVSPPDLAPGSDALQLPRLSSSRTCVLHVSFLFVPVRLIALTATKVLLSAVVWGAICHWCRAHWSSDQEPCSRGFRSTHAIGGLRAPSIQFRFHDMTGVERLPARCVARACTLLPTRLAGCPVRTLSTSCGTGSVHRTGV